MSVCRCHSDDALYGPLVECPACGHRSLDAMPMAEAGYAGCERRACGWETTLWPRYLLGRVVAPSFVAGVVFDHRGVVVEAAPILRSHLLGKSRRQARLYCERKGWRAAIVGPTTHSAPRGGQPSEGR